MKQSLCHHIHGKLRLFLYYKITVCDTYIRVHVTVLQTPKRNWYTVDSHCSIGIERLGEVFYNASHIIKNINADVSTDRNYISTVRVKPEGTQSDFIAVKGEVIITVILSVIQRINKVLGYFVFRLTQGTRNKTAKQYTKDNWLFYDILNFKCYLQSNWF